MCSIVETDLMIFKYAKVTYLYVSNRKDFPIETTYQRLSVSLNLRRTLEPIWKLGNLFFSWSNKSLSLKSIIFMVL